MSKTQSQLSLLDRLALIDKEVIRVLGKQKDNIITITSIDVFHSYVSACINTGVIAIDTETNNIKGFKEFFKLVKRNHVSVHVVELIKEHEEFMQSFIAKAL